MSDTLTSALYSIPASCDRATWWQVAAALKTELGEAGFTLFDSWSQAAPDKYDRSTTASTWRSVHAGRFTIGTVYHLARENGWQGQEPVRREPTPEEKRRAAEQRQREERRRRAVEERQAKKAVHILSLCEYTTHPYLTRKGFPDAKGLVHDGDLIVPMRHYRDYHRLQSVQMIGPDGSKKFLPRGKASEAVYKIGKGAERYYCEGYATALSVRAALRHLYRDRHSEVWVCFSAGNLRKVARRDGFVVADHDLWKCSNAQCRHRWDMPWTDQPECPSCRGTQVVRPAGARYAKQTGLPYWMPPEPGDANDFALEHGIGRLAVELRDLAMINLVSSKAS